MSEKHVVCQYAAESVEGERGGCLANSWCREYFGMSPPLFFFKDDFQQPIHTEER